MLKNLVNFFSSKKEPTQEERVKPWFSVDGDQTLRLNYDLNKDSIVFDLGGYKGQWTNDIYERYDCNIYCFEPVKEFADKIIERFINIPKISVFQMGLADKTTACMISNLEDSSSIYTGRGVERIKLISAANFILENNIRKIDLMKINIEGGEYDLLEHLLNRKLISIINNIQVQFHDFFPNAKKRMKRIQARLKKTHEIVWQYEFVWESWRRKSG